MSGNGVDFEDFQRLSQKVMNLAGSLQDMQHSMEAEMGAPSVLMGEVHQVKTEVEILKRSLEEESQARKTGDALSGEACMQLHAVVALEGKQRETIEQRLEEHLQVGLSEVENKTRNMAASLRAELAGSQSGFRERAVSPGQSEIERKVREVRQTLDLEAKERRNGDDDILQRIGELFVKLEQECGNRELADSNVRSQIGSWREELAMERAARGDQEAKIRCSFQKIEVSLMEKVNEVLLERENFATQFTQIKHRMNELNSNLDAEIEKRLSEFRKSLKNCEMLLGGSIDHHHLGMSAAGDVDMSTHRDLAVSSHVTSSHVTSTHRDLGTSTQRDLATSSHRDLATSTHRGLSTSTHRDIAMSTGQDYAMDLARPTGRDLAMSAGRDLPMSTGRDLAMPMDRRFGDSVNRDLVMHTSELKADGTLRGCWNHLKVLNEGLDAEAKERTSGDQITMARVRDIAVALDKEREDRIVGNEMVRSSFTEWREDALSDKEARVNELAGLRKEIQAFNRRLDGLTASHESSECRHDLHEAKLEVVVDAADQMKFIMEKLGVESNERRAADETLAQQIHDLQVRVQQEQGEREQADSTTRAQLASCLKELVTEKEKRVEENQIVHSVVRNFEESFGQHLSEVRLSLESEIQVRVQAGEALEKRQRLGADDSVRLLRQELQQEIAQRMADDDRLRSSIQLEMAFREKTQESSKQLVAKMEQLDMMMEKFASQSVLMKEREDRQMTERREREERQLEFKKEREERQLEDRTLHELLTSLTEQMNLVFDETHATWQGEVQNLWDALHSHTHDVHLKNPQDQGLEASSLGPYPNQSFGTARFPVTSGGSFAGMNPPGGASTSRMAARPAPKVEMNRSISNTNTLTHGREARGSYNTVESKSYNRIESQSYNRSSYQGLQNRGSYQDAVPMAWGK